MITPRTNTGFYTANEMKPLHCAEPWAIDTFLVKEEVVRIELLILQVIVSGSIERVAALFRDELKVSASRTSRRSVVEAGLKFNFLQGFRRRCDVVAQRTFIRRDVGCIDAVEEEACRASPFMKRLVAVAVVNTAKVVFTPASGEKIG